MVAILTQVQHYAVSKARDRCVKNGSHFIPPPMPRAVGIAEGNLLSFIDSRSAFTAGWGKPLHRLQDIPKGNFIACSKLGVSRDAFRSELR